MPRAKTKDKHEDITRGGDVRLGSETSWVEVEKKVITLNINGTTFFFTDDNNNRWSKWPSDAKVYYGGEKSAKEFERDRLVAMKKVGYFFKP